MVEDTIIHSEIYGSDHLPIELQLNLSAKEKPREEISEGKLEAVGKKIGRGKRAKTEERKREPKTKGEI